MKTPRTGRLVLALVRFYRRALGLYPAAFREAYAEEMQVIFRLRLEDAIVRGRRALFATGCKEALTLPLAALAAHAQVRKSPHFLSFFVALSTFLFERGSKMSIRDLFPKSIDKIPWFIAILSLAPFILPGPLAPLLNYHPWWDPNQLPFIEAARFPVTACLLILGFLIGIRKQFPRWSYVYALYIVFIVPEFILYLIDHFLFKIIPEVQGNTLILMALPLIIASPFLHFLRPFFSKIRQDWTLLSFTFYACAFFLLSTNEMEESPVYNLQVLLPSLLIWLGALAYLLLADPLHKVAVLFGAQFLGVLIWWWPILRGNSRTWSGFLVVLGMLPIYWLILGGLIIAPIILNVSFRRRGESIR